MTKQEQWALDRMVGRDGLPAILAALVQSYDFHLNNTNPKGFEDHIARLEREKILASRFAELAKEMTP